MGEWVEVEGLFLILMPPESGRFALGLPDSDAQNPNYVEPLAAAFGKLAAPVRK